MIVQNIIDVQMEYCRFNHVKVVFTLIQQQRLVIARALLNNPEVILADEPTGNLDPDVSDEVLSVLHEVCKQGKSVIMATHDYRLIDKFGGSIYKVGEGKVQKINGLDDLKLKA